VDTKKQKMNIKQKDLRIGNYVKCTNGITGFIESGIGSSRIRIKRDAISAITVPPELLEPVLIDDEIIKKWWTSRKNKKDDLVLSVTINSKKIHLVVEDKYYIRCDYLHQLQNAYFILTGKELHLVSDT